MLAERQIKRHLKNVGNQFYTEALTIYLIIITRKISIRTKPRHQNPHTWGGPNLKPNM